MASVKLNWQANPAAEQVTGYNIYRDLALIGVSPTPEYVDPQVAPGVHTYEVSAVNVWGESPKSDAVSTPGAASKPVGVSIIINVSVQV